MARTKQTLGRRSNDARPTFQRAYFSYLGVERTTPAAHVPRTEHDYLQVLESVVAATSESTFWHALHRDDKRSLASTCRSLRSVTDFLTSQVDIKLDGCSSCMGSIYIGHTLEYLKRLQSLRVLRLTLPPEVAPETLVGMLDTGYFPKSVTELALNYLQPRFQRPAEALCPRYDSRLGSALSTALPSLHDLTFEGHCHVTTSLISSLSLCTALRALTLSGVSRQQVDLADVTRLTRLTLAHMVDLDLKGLQHQTGLRELHWEHTQLRHLPYNSLLTHIPVLSRLHCLHLCGLYNLSVDQFESMFTHLSDLIELQLEWVEFQGRQGQAPPSTFLSPLQQLRSLSIINCPWFSDPRLEALQGLPLLEHLRIQVPQAGSREVELEPTGAVWPQGQAPTMAALKRLQLEGVDLRVQQYLMHAAPQLEELELKSIGMESLHGGVHGMDVVAMLLAGPSPADSMELPVLGMMPSACKELPRSHPAVAVAVQLEGSGVSMDGDVEMMEAGEAAAEDGMDTEMVTDCWGHQSPHLQGVGSRVNSLTLAGYVETPRLMRTVVETLFLLRGSALRCLCLEGSEALDERPLGDVITWLPHLQHVELKGFEVVDGACLMQLSRLNGLRQLQVLGAQQPLPQEELDMFCRALPGVEVEVEVIGRAQH